MTRVHATVSYAGTHLEISVRREAFAPSRLWARYDVARLRPFSQPLAGPDLFELLDLTVAIYALDRSVRIKAGHPSRAFEIVMPVADLATWRTTRAPLVNEWYRALTGDEIEISPVPRNGSAASHHLPVALPLEGGAAAVGLLSDGLDSLCGVDAAVRNGGRAFAVASVMTKGQREARIADVRGALRFEPAGVRSYCLDTNLRQEHRVREKSQRSRTVLAIVMGMTLARALGAQVVESYENGFGLLNLPVPNLQYGSMSSQVLNPAHLALWDRVSRAFFGNTIELRFPNRFQTKAEMVSQLSAIGRRMVARTDSGDSPRRISGSTIMHCGTCGSCRLRQLSLMHDLDLVGAEKYAWERTDSLKPDALFAMRYHTRMLARAVASSDPWTALVRLQPELRLLPYAEDGRLGAVRDEVRAAFQHGLRESTIALLRRHIAEVENWTETWSVDHAA